MAQNKNQADIEDVLSELLEKMGQLPSLVGQMGDILGKFTASVSPLVSALNSLFSLGKGSPDDTVLESQPKVDFTPLIEAMNRQVAISGRILAGVDRLIAIAASMAQKNLPTATPVAPTGTGGGTGTGAAAGGMSLVAVLAVAAAAIGVLAIAVGVAEREFHKLEAFVRLFNPTIILIFQQALDNLGATIGRAFVPVFQIMTQVVRQFTGVLAPVIQSLVPMVQQFAEIFGGIVLQVLTQFGSILHSMLPSFVQLAEVFQLVAVIGVNLFNSFGVLFRGLMMVSRLLFELSGLGIVVRVLTKLIEGLNQIFQILEEAFNIFEVVLNTIITTIMTFISSFFPVKDVMQALTMAVQYVIRNMYVLAIQLAKMAGLASIVDALIASVEAKVNPGGDTAAQTPQIKGIEQIAKDIALAAASAGGAAGGGGVANQQQFWQQTLKEMRDAAQNGLTIRQFLEMILVELRKLVLGGGGAGAPGQPPAPGGQGGLGGLPGMLGIPEWMQGPTGLGKSLRGLLRK